MALFQITITGRNRLVGKNPKTGAEVRDTSEMTVTYLSPVFAQREAADLKAELADGPNAKVTLPDGSTRSLADWIKKPVMDGAPATDAAPVVEHVEEHQVADEHQA